MLERFDPAQSEVDRAKREALKCGVNDGSVDSFVVGWMSRAYGEAADAYRRCYAELERCREELRDERMRNAVFHFDLDAIADKGKNEE